MIRLTFTNGTQSIEEICEHCQEKVKDVDITEITVKKPNDPRTLFLRNKLTGTNIEMKTKARRVSEIKAKASGSGLLDVSGEELKYRLRAESMCSESYDTSANITSSFCYRVTNAKFLAKYSASYYDANEYDANETGSKVGVDRKGNIIRIAEEKEQGATKYRYPFTVAWFRALNTSLKKDIMSKMNTCAYVRTNRLTLNDYRDYPEWRNDIGRNC